MLVIEVLTLQLSLKDIISKAKTRLRSGPFTITNKEFPYGTIELSSTRWSQLKVNGHRVNITSEGTYQPRYGYSKNRKKTVKTRQTRTRDGKECTRTEDLLVRKVKSQLQSTLGQPKSTH
ncbi:hypothetical protein Tco_1109521 [Tanacetum coccineum]